MSDIPEQTFPSPASPPPAPATERPAYPHDSQPQPDHRRIPPQTSAGERPDRAPDVTRAPAPPHTPSPAPRPGPSPAAQQSSDRAREALLAVRREMGKAVVGQDAAVSGVIICLLVRGHVLLEGVPGVAKTLLVRALAKSLAIETKRVQFTPDLMPGDITGSLVYDNMTSEFVFREGPVFTNLLLADEINRTPPKTQASLLEAMEERQVSVDGVPRPLPQPFLVAATQNPVEYEGTYPLPEAQLDRFLLKVVLPLPPRNDELEIIRRHASGFDPRDLDAAGLQAVAGPDDLAAGVEAVRAVTVAPEVEGYIVDIARATRSAPSLSLGASPRGATALLATSRAWAWMNGRTFVTPDDVKALAHATLAHRLSLRPEAELEGVSVGSVLASAIGSVAVPR
ncbi:MAG: MoxR family ATPase [Lapillicoccus sp.]